MSATGVHELESAVGLAEKELDDWASESNELSITKNTLHRALTTAESSEASLDKTVKRLQAHVETLDLGPARSVVLKRRLMDLRKNALEALAIEKIETADPDGIQAFFAEVARLAQSESPDVSYFLRNTSFQEKETEGLRARVIERQTAEDTSRVTRSLSEAAPNHPSLRFRWTAQVVEQALAQASSIVAASHLAQDHALPVVDVQWALEDLADKKLARRICQAQKPRESTRPHRSRTAADWNDLLGVPLRCLDCAVWFRADPEDIMIYYESTESNDT